MMNHTAPIDSFAFHLNDGIFLFAWHVPISVAIIYYGGLAVVRRWMAKREAMDLRYLVQVHSVLLCAASGVLFLLMSAEIGRLWMSSSFVDVFCDEAGQFTSGRIYYLYYVNYLFKYWELLDTFLLVLRKRKTPFLHVYHHYATLVLCWSQMYGQSCMQWAVILPNLAVHVVMYLYYALYSMGVRVWWKKLLTSLQIAQFVLDVIACVLALGSRFLHDALAWAGKPPTVPRCYGTYEGAVFGIGIIVSYLVLFLFFFKRTYKRPKTD